MEPDPKIPPFDGKSKTGTVGPRLPAPEPPVIRVPPPLPGGSPPPLRAKATRQSTPAQQLVVILLNLCLGFFLADAVVSLVDDSLILFFDVHLLAGIRGIIFFFSMLTAIVIYGLMGLAPIIPKRFFLPLTLINLVAQLVWVPFLIYSYDRFQQVDWAISCCQVIFGLGMLYWIQGGFKFRWPLVAADQLRNRRFSWRNLSVFALANVFVLLPAVIIYLVFCAALAVGHFSEGFLALRPGGFSVQARKYVRSDGKTIQLFPMAHVADSGFYRRISQSFPTNSIILMEGVTDEKNLLTNKLSYKRMAKSLGLTEQKEKFAPSQGEIVGADVDVEEFSTNTIDFLNLVTLLYSKGVNAEILLRLARYSPPPNIQEQILEDLLRKRNQHLLQEIHAHLPEADHIMVPWGVAHMPEIAREIQKSGFHLSECQEYQVIRFHSIANEGTRAKPK